MYRPRARCLQVTGKRHRLNVRLLRVTVGRRTMAAGEVEVQLRRGRETSSVLLEDAAEEIAALWRGLP